MFIEKPSYTYLEREVKSFDFYTTHIEWLMSVARECEHALLALRVPAADAFYTVHRANMAKKPGIKPTRTNSQGFDAIKPEGWKAPDWEWLKHDYAKPARNTSISFLTNIFMLETDAFNSQIIQYPKPTEVQYMLSPERLLWAKEVLNEELSELRDAETLEDTVDAIVDLLYFTLGRLYELGYTVNEGVVLEALRHVKWQCIESVKKAKKFSRYFISNCQTLIAILGKAPYYEMHNKAVALRSKKRQDYERGNISQSDYFPFGVFSHIQMINLKLLRLESLHASSGLPNFESIQDTLLDLINYLDFFQEFLDTTTGQWGDPIYSKKVDFV